MVASYASWPQQNLREQKYRQNLTVSDAALDQEYYIIMDRASWGSLLSRLVQMIEISKGNILAVKPPEKRYR
jgi:hypothetical protein